MHRPSAHTSGPFSPAPGQTAAHEEHFCASMFVDTSRVYPFPIIPQHEVEPVLRIRIRIQIRIRSVPVFLGHPDPDPDPLSFKKTGL